MVRELQSALDSAGFPLRKWTSNHKEILAHIQSDQLLTTDFLEIDTESTAKNLGVRWKATSGEFFFVPPDLNARSFSKLPSCLTQQAGSLHFLCVPNFLWKSHGFRI